MKSIGLVILVCLFLGLGVYLFQNQPQKSPGVPSGKVEVVVSFYPLEAFTHGVGQELVHITNMTPPGVEPHDFEPTPADISHIYAAKLFIFNGNGVDRWAEKIAADVASHGVHVVEMSKEIDILDSSEGNDKTPRADPHFWLDPVFAQQEAEVIADALTTLDPSHMAQYTQNKSMYTAVLAQLHTEYTRSLAQCVLHEIVTSHDAFRYMSKRYGFSVLALSGLSPDEEPSPQKIAEIATLAKQKNIKYIFFETLVSPKISQTVANEIGAQILVFNPIEGLQVDDRAAGKEYSSIMRENLVNLKKALICQ